MHGTTAMIKHALKMWEIVLWLKTTIHQLNLAVWNIERMHRKRRVIFGSSFISIALSHTNKLIHFHWHTTYSVSAGPGVIVLFFINLSSAHKYTPTSNCMHGMIQTEAWLHRRGTLWNVSVSKHCKHYQKLTASYQFGGYVLPGILILK